jgi:DNA-binding response OmpR family regulator
VAELVHLLQDHAGQPVPIEIIGPQVWGYPVDASLLNTIYATVCEARRNLPDRRWIVTRRGWQQPGYAWAGPPPVVLEQERAA